MQSQRQKTMNFSRARTFILGMVSFSPSPMEVKWRGWWTPPMFQENNIELGEATVFMVRGKQAYSLSLRDIFPLPCKHNSEK